MWQSAFLNARPCSTLRVAWSRGRVVSSSLFCLALAVSLSARVWSAQPPASDQGVVEVGPSEVLRLPEPYHTESVRNRSRVIGWPEGRTPTAPPGFRVQLYAGELDSPRRSYVLPNQDVLVVESRREFPGRPVRSADRITLFRDADRDGRPELRGTFLEGLNKPYGMLLLGSWLYVANTDGLVRFPYESGQTRITAPGEKILDLPQGGHYTRNLIADPGGARIYIAVGSKSNVDEEGEDAKDPRRAAILEVNPDGSGMSVFASGLRNPVGMAWEPGTGKLWTVVNERDRLGDALVPDYLTSVKDGGFYGWPYSYFGQNVDPRKKGERPDLVAKALVPDFALGAHVAALGLAFYDAEAFPGAYRGGAFIGQHGSWNRSELVGYNVVFVPFENGAPSGEIREFLTGFVADPDTAEVYGRPVGVTVLPDGSLLVADDAGGAVWRVSYEG